MQGGIYSSPAVAAALQAIAANQTAGVGQSSWGPTGFAFVESAGEAERALAAVRAASRDTPAIAYAVVTGRNRGATWRAADLERCGIDAA